ncbi:MAG TPA: hypothetical protein VEB68_08400 [Croceibacterium sp.]|nr:hypothetical protein [Croceibacterium sp.]
MRRFVLVGAALLAGSCDRPPEPAPTAAEPVAEACGDTDVACLNEQLMQQLEQEERLQPKLSVEDALGEWTVAAAIERIGRDAGGTWVATYAHRDVWLGSAVSVTREAITIEAAAGAPVMREGAFDGGELYPRCTRPEFETDMRHSAGAMADLIDLWQHFGLKRSSVGRPLIIHCTGGPEFPDDGSGHVAEMTVEESYGIELAYLYDRDHLIVQWGSLEFLLRRSGGRPG